MSKRLGGIIGCKNKTSSWHLNGITVRHSIRAILNVHHTSLKSKVYSAYIQYSSSTTFIHLEVFEVLASSVLGLTSARNVP